MNKPSVALIGAGSAGSAVAVALCRAGYPIVAVSSRTIESAKRCAALVACDYVSTDLAAASRRAEVVIIATPDSVIEETCGCGRTLPRHARLMGRTDDMMKIKGVICFPKQIEEGILAVRGASENYQIIKFKKGAFVDLKVMVEPTEERAKEKDLDKLAARISESIHSIVGLDVTGPAPVTGR